MRIVTNLPQLVDALKCDRELAVAARALKDAAQAAASLPSIRRAYSLEEVGHSRTFRDDRLLALEDEIKETFALAMSDLNEVLPEELPLIAAGFRIGGEEPLRQRVIEQLEEMAGWSPLQRPGWSLCAPGQRLPPDGNDGTWLVTGLGVRTIADTLEMMPQGSLNSNLILRLHDLLEQEVGRIIDDWQTGRSWFIRSNNAITNQWVLPTEGLIRACLILGTEVHREAYEMGVKNMLQAIDAHGEEGEFEEGIHYATFTVSSMLSAASAMACAGDDRCISHRFLQRFPRWMVHHLQPGRILINCFDAFQSAVPRSGGAYRDAFRKLLGSLAVSIGSPVALWALQRQFDAPADNLHGILSLALPSAGEQEPSLFASYERACRVNWRDSWEDNASGCWIRGGHPLDQHDHQDRGHVNFIAEGRPLLIEAGTPAYHDPLLTSHYSSGCGHNVLQLGESGPDSLPPGPGATLPAGWQQPGGVAPIKVVRLDAAGGQVLIDGTACYQGLQQWWREVKWYATQLRVQDSVMLEAGHSEIVLFRWHLGTTATPRLKGWGRAYELKWQQAEMAISASANIEIEFSSMPDHTLVPRRWNDDASEAWHTCIVVKSAESVASLKLTTLLIPHQP